MATAAQPEAGPRARGGDLVRRFGPGALTVVGVALLMRLVYAPWYLNYDARYALLWARDIVHGHTPDYEAAFAPTPHPLSTAWSMLAIPFGQDGDRLIVWSVLLSFGAVVWLAYRLGAELFSRPVGLVAALTVVTRPALERDALLGYQDVPFGVLVLAAVLLEARRPRRGTAPLVLLAAAGLLRPEAWVLAGLYWLYLFPHRTWPQRVRLAGLVVLGPVVWFGMDLIVTGDALHSLHGTAALAETAGRRRRVDQVPFWTAKYFGYVLREPLVLGVPLGLAFAWRFRLRGAVLPLAVAAAMVLVFAVNPVFGLPLIGRYVRTPAVLLSLFYGLAVAGWLMLRARAGVRRGERRAWQAVAAVAVLASVVYLPWHVDLLRGLERRVDTQGHFYAGLRDVGRSPAVRAAAARCGTLSAADHRPVPYLRYWLGAAPGAVTTFERGGDRPTRLRLYPRRVPVVRGFYKENFPRARPPAGFVRVYRDRPGGCTPRRAAREPVRPVRPRGPQMSSSVTASWPTSRNSV